MNVTVCQMSNDPNDFESAWHGLATHVQDHGSEFVLLPEMPFSPWLSASATPDVEQWQRAVDRHLIWLHRLSELGAGTVIGSRPVLDGGRRFNEGFIWHSGELTPAHRKVYLPDEPGFWEATWYDPGAPVFDLFEIDGVRVGFLICTEIWFTKHAREYMKDGIDLLVCPRATAVYSTDKWIAGGRAAAVVSGAFCLSSNFSGEAGEGCAPWGGTAWIVEPEEGSVLATSTEESPFRTVQIDLEVARTAKTTYPRYVKD